MRARHTLRIRTPSITDETLLTSLESQWETVNMQTSWKLQPCFMQTEPPPGPQVDVSEPNGRSNDTPVSTRPQFSQWSFFRRAGRGSPSNPNSNSVTSPVSSRPSASRSFSVMYFNCRSLLSKIDELAALCSTNMPDVVCLVETWLCMDILDTEISIPNYSIVRLDRNRHGGGVAMYIRSSVSYNVILYGSAGLEVIVVSLSKCNRRSNRGTHFQVVSKQQEHNKRKAIQRVCMKGVVSKGERQRVK